MTNTTAKNRIFSGIQPTNKLTLGNYLGAIQNWVTLQDQTHTDSDLPQSADNLFCIVNLHAITVPQDPESLRKATFGVAAAYLASGIDPKKSHIFVQSHVPAHTELAWLLSCSTPMGWLNRMTQFKDKAGKNKDKVGLGLYAYPTLMAADILLYDTTHVPVGEDQKQHVELTRDIAQSMNHHYQEDIFVMPEPVIFGEAKRVMSLRDGTKKMSKSDPSEFSRIHLTDSNDEISQKIRKAKTDPLPLPGSLDELESRPEAKNLVTIYAALFTKPIQNILSENEGKNFSDFKPLLAEALIAKLSPIRDEILRYQSDLGELEAILNKGAHYANERANNTIERVKKTMGL